LPRETQGYVPAFLATMYVYEYSKEHGITPKRAPLTYFETDTVMVKRQMSFKQIASLLDVPVEQLQFLNPIYKLDVVPYVKNEPHYVRLPKNKVGLFASNEKAIYAYIDHMENLREKPFFAAETAVASTDSYGKKSTTKTHLVKRGDNLGAIAIKYDVSVADLRKWNKLKGNRINAGQRLKIHKTVIVKEPAEKETAVAANAKAKKEVPAADAKSAVAENQNTNAAEAETAEEESAPEAAVAVKETKRSKTVN